MLRLVYSHNDAAKDCAKNSKRAARKLGSKFVEELNGIANGLPVVDTSRRIHYACGDNEAGD